MLRYSIAIMIVCSFLSCKKDIGIPNPPIHPTCSVAHDLDLSKNGTLKDTWRFVGFQAEGSDQIESPPCDIVDYDNNGSPSFTWTSGATLSFPDTLRHDWQDSMFSSHPHVYNGSVINYFYGGCEYDHVNLKISPGGKTLVYGPVVFMDLEKKFLTILHDAKTYKINHNLLTINCETKGKMLFVLK